MRITLHSRTFSVIDRYAPGHVLTEGEAKVLNEHMAKKLRERLRKSWRRYGKRSILEHHVLQRIIDRWVEDFVCVDGPKTVERAGKAADASTRD